MRASLFAAAKKFRCISIAKVTRPQAQPVDPFRASATRRLTIDVPTLLHMRYTLPPRIRTAHTSPTPEPGV